MSTQVSLLLFSKELFHNLWTIYTYIIFAQQCTKNLSFSHTLCQWRQSSKSMDYYLPPDVHLLLTGRSDLTWTHISPASLPLTSPPLLICLSQFFASRAHSAGAHFPPHIVFWVLRFVQCCVIQHILHSCVSKASIFVWAIMKSFWFWLFSPTRCVFAWHLNIDL